MVKTVSSLHNSVQRFQISSYTGPTIACTICSAAYAPSQAQPSLVQAPRIAFESALMSMCHFCFRCRRPSCPLCWDDVHGICGACDEEVHLPFRREGEPLPMNSSLLNPNPQRGLVRTPHYPLVCVSPGRFQALIPAAEKALNTDPVDMSALVPATPAKTTIPSTSQHAECATPVQEGVDTRTVPVVKPKQRVGVARRIERTVTLLLGIVIFLIAVLIFVAALSTQANTLIAHALHVDIRKEIEYLLQLIQQNH